MNDPFEFSPAFVDVSLKDMLGDLRRTHRNSRVFTKARVEELLGRPVTRTEYRKLAPKPSVPAALVELKVHRKLISELPRKSRLACFSESWESLPMWAHYADSHSGVCVSYRLDTDSARTVEQDLPLPVSYCDNRPAISALDLRAFTGRGPKSAHNARVVESVHDKVFLTKAAGWSYEKEWRLFDNIGLAPAYKKFQCLRVEAVYFGMNAEAQYCERAERDFGSRVKIFRLKPSKDRFGLAKPAEA